MLSAFLLLDLTAIEGVFLKLTDAELKCFILSGGREMVDVVLHLVVNQLSEDIFVLPSPLCVLFKALEENCASRGVKTPHNCAGIKVRIVSVRLRVK